MSTAYIPDRPIAFHREYARLGAGVAGALLLSQMIHYSRTAGADADAWIHATADQLEEETGLSRREQETARKRLKSLGILEERKQGIPCRTFYRVNIVAIVQALSTSKQEGSA